MDRLLTLKETGKLLNVSKQTLQRWDNSGKLIAVRTEGGHRRYKLSDIEKILGENDNLSDEKKEIVDKLLLKGYQKEVVLAAVEKLEEYHYVDDFLFAKHFVEQNSKYSRVMIEVKLRQRGVDSECIAVAFENFEQEDELIFCQKQVDKYLKGKDLNKQGIREKLTASLLRKGFKINTIKLALKKFSLYNDDDTE